MFTCFWADRWRASTPAVQCGLREPEATFSSLSHGPPQQSNLLHQNQQGRELASKKAVRMLYITEVTSHPPCCILLDKSGSQVILPHQGQGEEYTGVTCDGVTARRQESLGATLEPAHRRRGYKCKHVVNCQMLFRGAYCCHLHLGVKRK